MISGIKDITTSYLRICRMGLLIFRDVVNFGIVIRYTKVSPNFLNNRGRKARDFI